MATTTNVKVLTQGVQLPTTAAAQYSAPANTTTLIKAATVTNTTASAATLTLYKVASAGTVGVANMLINAKAIPANSTVILYEVLNHALAAGDSVQAFSGTATALTLHLSGIEIV